MDSYRIELAAAVDVDCDPILTHHFRFPDDALDCARALADAHGRERVQCYWWASAFVREPDGTCEDASGWEWLSLADLELDAAAYWA